MNFLKRKYVAWCIRRKQVNRKKQFLNIADIQSAAVFIPLNEKNESLLPQLKKMMKETAIGKVHYWATTSSKTFIDYDVDTLRKDDVKFGKPSAEKEQDFLAQKVDVVINLSLQESLPLDYLMGISEAKCRCGLQRSSIAEQEVSIRMPECESEEDLLRQILHYLKTINSNS